MMRCKRCQGSGWHLRCPERLASCPYICSPRCCFGTCHACDGSGQQPSLTELSAALAEPTNGSGQEN